MQSTATVISGLTRLRVWKPLSCRDRSRWDSRGGAGASRPWSARRPARDSSDDHASAACCAPTATSCSDVQPYPFLSKKRSVLEHSAQGGEGRHFLIALRWRPRFTVFVPRRVRQGEDQLVFQQLPHLHLLRRHDPV